MRALVGEGGHGSLAVSRSWAEVRWTTVLVALLAVIFFIPAKRYTLPGSGAIQLEPYRFVVLVVILGWVGSLLADTRTRLHASRFDPPIGMILATVLASELANPGRVATAGTYATKAVSFLVSYLLVYYLIVGVVRRRADLELLVRVLVAFGAVLALLALVETRTHYNVFDHLVGTVPLLSETKAPALTASDLARNGTLRAYASAQHPIALGALLAMLLPLALYLTGARRRWWLAVGLLAIGELATQSRTGVLMLVVASLVFVCLRPRNAVRLWPAFVPLLIAVHFAVPGAIGSVTSQFFPKGGLVAQQSNIVRGNQLSSNGRLADVGPALGEFGGSPLLGMGYGTRVTTGPDQNAAILDDAWLGTLLEVGLLGTVGWVWLFFRAVQRLAHDARRDRGGRGSLLTAAAASLAGFGVGLFTYDAFSFVQVTFVFFVILALASCALATPWGERSEHLVSAAP